MGIFSIFSKKNKNNQTQAEVNEKKQSQDLSALEKLPENASLSNENTEKGQYSEERTAEIKENFENKENNSTIDFSSDENKDDSDISALKKKIKEDTTQVSAEDEKTDDSTVEIIDASKSLDTNDKKETTDDSVNTDNDETVLTDKDTADDEKADLSSDQNEQTELNEKKVKLTFFERLKRTRENLALGIGALVSGKKIDEDLYEELETALLTADLGVETTQKVIEKLRAESKLRDLKDAGALKNNLKNILKDILRPCQIPLDVTKKGNNPYVILMVGVNGAGKTTTIGKLALKYKDEGKKVMLAAGDTFRAAAVEQLKAWGDRTNTPVISQPTGSDSASVIFDALTSAIAHNVDVLICDTAGRLQNKDNLMEELKKIVRVMKKIDENVPNEVLLVLDATTGQNAVSQMKIFGEAVNVSGLALTKLDGTAKGGVVFALADKFNVPLRYVGIGESKEDLRVFDVDNFVDALF